MKRSKIENILLATVSNSALPGTGIVCFYTSTNLPDFVEPMLRSPNIPLGSKFDITFSDKLLDAIKLNPSVHDGAILVGRETSAGSYNITGWSCRLFPPSAPVEFVANRGSAFNSCHAMSVLHEVDAIYLWSSGKIYRFENGRIFRLNLIERVRDA